MNQIGFKNGPFKALGVWFAHNQQEITDLNYTNRLKDMEGLINIWRSRGLSLKGKIIIIKTLILPQIQFLFSMIYTPDIILKRVDNILFSFLWDNKPPKIKRSTIISPIVKGGLGMIDVYAVHDAAKCSWVRRLFDGQENKWKLLFEEMIELKISNLNKNINPKSQTFGKTEFHKQLLNSWFKVSSSNPTTLRDILNQFVTYNQHIQINQTMVNNLFSEDANVKIRDIIDANGKVLSINNLNDKFNINLTLLKYNALLCSIPKKWKEILRNNSTCSDQHTSENIENIPKLEVGNKMKLITKITSKELYLLLNREKIEPPTSINVWANIYPFFENLDWSKIYTLPYAITTEPYLQSFQYKVLNRILNTREKLFTWKIAGSNKCQICTDIDTIEHHLFKCPASQTMWIKLESWLYDNLARIKIFFHRMRNFIWYPSGS